MQSYAFKRQPGQLCRASCKKLSQLTQKTFLHSGHLYRSISSPSSSTPSSFGLDGTPISLRQAKQVVGSSAADKRNLESKILEEVMICGLDDTVGSGNAFTGSLSSEKGATGKRW